ncbi:hypothetical protein KKG58_00860 [Patescibacteria group bacterium]|nr:hypothetical protein [Patescibacteria group bacterium]
MKICKKIIKYTEKHFWKLFIVFNIILTIILFRKFIVIREYGLMFLIFIAGIIGYGIGKNKMRDEMDSRCDIKNEKIEEYCKEIDILKKDIELKEEYIEKIRNKLKEN